MSTAAKKKNSSRIRDAGGSPGARVKIVDVASAAGVSATTVSHALNGRGYVDARTREMVKQVALRLGYRPNRHAQRLRTGEAHTIVLVSSIPFAVAGGPSRLGFMMEIAAAAAGIALARGLALVLAPPVDGGSAALDHLDIDGALVLEPAESDPMLAALRGRGVPVVSIGKPPGAPLPHVDLHSAATTRLLLEHLHAQGARRVALVTGAQRRSSYLEAIAAYETFAAARRMAPVVATVDEARGEEGGRAVAHELLARHPDLDAICAPVDALAVGVVQALRERGRRVPQDVLVDTRYDGLRARTCEPPLTALNLHLDDVATQAIDLLLEHLRGDTARRAVDGAMAELIVRASTQKPQ